MGQSADDSELSELTLDQRIEQLSTAEGSPRYSCINSELDGSGRPLIDVLYDEEGELREGVDLAPLTVAKQTRLARISYLVRAT